VKRRMVYTLPPQMEPVPGTEDRNPRPMQRVPGSPTREARSWEYPESWLETVEDESEVSRG